MCFETSLSLRIVFEWLNLSISGMKLVVIGSITEDIIISPSKKESRYIGGVPVYAAAIAKALEESIGIVSKVGTDFHLNNLKTLHSLGPDLRGFKISGESSMVFENRYTPKGRRVQRLLATSEKITFSEIPTAYLSISCVHLGPVFNEIPIELISQVRKHYKLVSLDAQGFTRSVDKKKGHIVLKSQVDLQEILPYIDILKVDDNEIKCLTSSTKLADAIATVLAFNLDFLIITRAHKGAIIFHHNQRIDIPAFPTTIVDETGAGDTFIVAFLLTYLATVDAYYSGLVAASAASYKIATAGPFPTYTRDDILTKVQTFLATQKHPPTS